MHEIVCVAILPVKMVRLCCSQEFKDDLVVKYTVRSGQGSPTQGPWVPKDLKRCAPSLFHYVRHFRSEHDVRVLFEILKWLTILIQHWQHLVKPAKPASNDNNPSKICLTKDIVYSRYLILSLVRGLLLSIAKTWTKYVLLRHSQCQHGLLVLRTET